MSYALSAQYVKAAESMSKTIKVMRNKNDWEQKNYYNSLMEGFEEISKNHIDIETITNDKIKKNVETAEKLLEFEIPDYSSVIMHYGKAIELMMREKIVYPIHIKIKQNPNCSQIEEEFKKINSRNVFKSIFNRKKPTFGAWMKIK
jgi:hypothetical protein